MVQEFNKNLAEQTSYLGSLYRHIFWILPENELSKLLECWKQIYIQDNEFWYSTIHKSIRQGDVFNIRAYQEVNKLTPKQKLRLSEIRITYDEQYEDFKKQFPNEDIKDYHIFNQSPTRLATLNQLRTLNDIACTKVPHEISGHLDMILWNTIHIDENNLLKQMLEKTFKSII